MRSNYTTRGAVKYDERAGKMGCGSFYKMGTRVTRKARNLHANQNAKWLCSNKARPPTRRKVCFLVGGAGRPAPLLAPRVVVRLVQVAPAHTRRCAHTRWGVRARAGPPLSLRSRAATRQGAGRTARARSLRGCGLRSGIGLSTRGSVAPYGLPAFACHLFHGGAGRPSGACPDARPCPLANGGHAKKMLTGFRLLM